MNLFRRMILYLLLALAICAIALAQEPGSSAKVPTPPTVCKPCLWYSGDFNPNNSKANGAANEKDILVSASAVSVPFRVPKGQTWNVIGMFGVMLALQTTFDPKRADWSIARGVSAGNGGRVIASGTSPATETFVNCGNVDLFCITILVKGLHVALKHGRYWLTVVPYCTNLKDCGSQRFFLADEEDDPHPLNHVGPKNILDASYVTSKQFNLFYSPTWGHSGICSGVGCDMFSVGVLGKAVRDSGNEP